MNKKAELTTQQLVTLIILITSFAILLFFLLRLNLGEETIKEICHNSVVMKDKTLLSKATGNLDCQTEYLCFSKSEDCEGINPTRVIEIKNKEELVAEVEKEIKDCWWMFGEGKLNYVGFDVSDYHCAICSILKFDKDIQEKYPEIEVNTIIAKRKILTNEKYSIFTGMNYDVNTENKYLEADIILNSDLGDKEKSRCGVFDLTKA